MDRINALLPAWSPDRVSELLRLLLAEPELCESLPSRTLDLSGYQLSALPVEIGLLQPLLVLTLQWSNSLTILPESLGDLIALRTLNIRLCDGLSRMPESLGRLA